MLQGISNHYRGKQELVHFIIFLHEWYYLLCEMYHIALSFSEAAVWFSDLFPYSNSQVFVHLNLKSIFQI